MSVDKQKITNPLLKTPDVLSNDIDAAVEAGVVEKSDLPAQLTMETMFKMFLEVIKGNKEANEKLAEALLESRKPYVDPNVLKQKQEALEERRRMVAAQLLQKQLTKEQCPHVRDNGTPNIKWMQHSNGIVLGTCGTCFSEFNATTNAADRELLRKDLKSLKNMGRAGAHAARNAVVTVG